MSVGLPVCVCSKRKAYVCVGVADVYMCEQVAGLLKGQLQAFLTPQEEALDQLTPSTA